MYKPKNNKERIEHRYKISLGHLKKVIDMVDSGAYCIDVILQSQAVQKALRATDEVLLENHLKTCAANMIKKGESDKAIKEIMAVLKNQKNQ
jgi:DNA-binding FrmR family transcriptional regulator